MHSGLSVTLAVGEAEQRGMDAAQRNGLAWAVSCWQAEVSQRPLVNVHRRTLDDTWRQVIRYFGGDPEKLIGPSHDTLLMHEQEPSGINDPKRHTTKCSRYDNNCGAVHPSNCPECPFRTPGVKGAQGEVFSQHTPMDRKE